jgi:hypothetical protein
MTTVESYTQTSALPGSHDAAIERRSLFFVLLAIAIAAGIVLRFLQIGDQIIADDEWHSLHTLLNNDYATIFTHFGICDHCIPLTLYDKLVADTLGLSEWSMRAPMLLCGCLALIVFPWLFIDYLGARNTIVFTWLLAISPLHIYFSRYARPYAIVFLLLIVGTVAFARWWSSGRAAWALLFAACAILAPWFHSACLPYVAAPFACVLWLAARRARKEGRSISTIFSRDLRPGFLWLAIAVAAGVCTLIAPPLITDWQSLAARTGQCRFRLPSPSHTYELLSGAQLPFVAFASGLAFLLGLVSMLEKQRGILAYFVLVPAVQILALTLSGPNKFDEAIVFVRYAMPILVVFLWISAAGLEHLDRLIRKQWKRAPAHAATISMCIVLPAFGPLVQSYRSPNNWTNAAMYQFGYSPRFQRLYAATVLNMPEMPAIYGRLKQIDDPDMRIVEAPWNFEWNVNQYPVYQFVHNKKTVIGFVDDPDLPPQSGELPFGDRRFHFHNFVHVNDFDGLRQRKVRFVIFHRDVSGGRDDRRTERMAEVERWRKEYIERVGKPVYDDAHITVFDLEPRAEH